MNFFKRAFGCLLLVALLGGCASNKTPKPTQSAEPVITVTLGVRQQVYPWRESLTLSRALILFGYQPGSIPDTVSLIRSGQDPMYVDTFQLMQGQTDLVLEPGDRVVIHPHQ